MTLAYLTLERARTLISNFGSGTSLTDEQLTSILTEIELMIDGWVGYRAAQTEHQLLLTTNSRGTAVIPIYRITEILEILYREASDPSNSLTSLHPVSSLWDGKSTVSVGFESRAIIQVRLLAGYLPENLPPPFKLAATALLLQADSTGNIVNGMLNPTAFDATYRDPQSISLPGGVSKTFLYRDGDKPAPGRSATMTDLDHILSRYLQQYRKVLSWS